MPIEFTIQDPEQVRCVLVKLPVVLAEDEAQVLVDSTFCLPELAKKIDHIDVRVEDLEVDLVFIHGNNNNWVMEIEKQWPQYNNSYHNNKNSNQNTFIKKVILHGVLHKQIYYVNRDDAVKHVAEDVPFTKMIELRDAIPVIDQDEVRAQFFKPRVDISWELMRGSRLQQTGVIIVRFKLVEDRQIFVMTCPPPVICPPGNLVVDPGLEQWVTSTTLLLWGSVNVERVTVPDARTGNAAALGGPAPALDAAIFQLVSRGIAPGLSYRLCFYARENLVNGAEGTFTLEGRVDFIDVNGNVLTMTDQSWNATQVSNTTFTQFCLNTGPAPEGTVAASVRIAKRNGGIVKVDDVSLTCVQNR